MLNVKEVTEILKNEEITESEETVIRWILEGKLSAQRTEDYKIDFLMHPSVIAAFIIEKKIESSSRKYGVDYLEWNKTFEENQSLKEKIEELTAIVRIEQAKVRSLRKMLLAESALNSLSPKSFYKLFGMDETADPEQLKKEFKKLLKSLHPDRGGDERLFKVFYEHYKNTIDY
jgi:hypothetical protein